ncbi:MAG: cob(I)yrinic acid a,c-diamide adenosyltransferase [Planctomycetota bacterium]|nr:cob(I)yrinic acid a,c-diamide adenosyltransferase [Planctomycetota bacterium]
MVKLTKIYTRTGDDGTTGLATGQRVRKDDLRVDTYGSVDEANACIGLAVREADHAATSPGAAPAAADIASILRAIQHDLFDLGADLATPVAGEEPAGSRLRIIPTQVARLETTIDRFNDTLAPLTSFVLPGGSALASHLHVARTVVRRAERLAVALAAREPGAVNPEAVKYLNRLSDLLFVLGRVANDSGAGDVLWKPGANR